MSASFSKARLKRRKLTPIPNWLPLRHDGAGGAADDGAEDLPGDGADLVLLRLACLGRAVPQGDVRHLVGHDADHLALARGRLDHPAVHVHRAAGQREGVDLLHVYDLERVPELGVPQLRRDRVHESVTQVFHVRGHPVVVQDWHLPLDFRRSLTPELHVV